MDEDPFWQREFFNQTTLHPVGVSIILAFGLAALLVLRRYAVYPFLLIACFVAPAQRVVIASLNFNPLRLTVLFGWSRLIRWRQIRHLTWKPIDWAMPACQGHD